MGVSSNGGTPISHPKMMIFSRENPMVVGETHAFRKPTHIARRFSTWTSVGEAEAPRYSDG